MASFTWRRDSPVGPAEVGEGGIGLRDRATTFALATSYWLARRNLTEDDKQWLRWVLMAGAPSVDIERVLAGKHTRAMCCLGWRGSGLCLGDTRNQTQTRRS